MSDEELTEEGSGGLGRRDLLKRGAVLGGALVWTAPAVQTLAGPAYANHGSPPPAGGCTYTFNYQAANNNVACFTYGSADPQKCQAFASYYCGPGGQNAVLAFLYAFQNDPGGIHPIGFTCNDPQSPPVCP